jgi:para-nitrobenzyl esterase
MLPGARAMMLVAATRSFVLLFLFAAGVGLPGSADARLPQRVRIDTGRIEGAPARIAAVMSYRGLPYAAPPIGRLRWRAPEAPRSWSGVRQAVRPGAVCPQPATDIIAGLMIDEDCLNLDVWTGAVHAGEHRPVMVWFHGGERGFGAGSQPIFDGTALAKKGVVLVTVNYRGGPLGLLATPELSMESGHHASGNYALLDNIAALRWVQRNIAAFGGDPRNVTIFGQSFGAGTSHFLSLSPLAKGLFHRMINESHALYPRDPAMFQAAMRYLPLKDGEADGQAFMRIAGVRSLAELRALPWQALVEAYRKSKADLLWTYVQDGYVLPRTYAQTYAAAAQADVYELAGENADESGAAADTAFDVVAAGKASRPNNSIALLGRAAYLDYVHKKFGAMADEYLTLYPAADDRGAFVSANAAIRDSARVSQWMWAGAFTHRRAKPVYLYFFTQAPPGPAHDVTGAYHGAELQYVFANPEPDWSPRDRRVADLMSSYWTNFARNGDPNGPGLPHWPMFVGPKQRTMELGRNFGPIPLAGKEKVGFWQRFFATQPAR